MTLREREHWNAFFGEDYVRFSEVILSPERTAFEAQRIVELLQLPPDAAILDLGCGQGRLSIELARRGYRVTGVDASKELLEVARRRTAEAHQKVTYLETDMRDLDFTATFDAVINVGTAYGYIDDEAGDQLILSKVYTALKPEGVFLQETENRDYKLQGLRNTWNHMNGRPVFSERIFNPVNGRWREHIFWYEGDQQRSSLLELRLYSATELIRMIRTAGLNVEQVYGGFDASELTVNSSRLVILSRKEQGHV